MTPLLSIRSLLPLSLLGLVSCSIPLGQRNLGVGYHSTNPKNNAHRQVVVGVDIQKQPGASTTIGWSEATLLNPTHDHQQDNEPLPTGFQFPFAWRWNDSQGTSHTLGWSLSLACEPNPDCHFIHIRRTGISTGYGQPHRGLTFGSISGTILRANPNHNAVYQLDYHSSSKGENKLRTLIK